jgi:hypothetical protein
MYYYMERKIDHFILFFILTYRYTNSVAPQSKSDHIRSYDALIPYLQTSSLIIFLLSMSMSLPGSYLQTSSLIIFLLSMSMSLPGSYLQTSSLITFLLSMSMSLPGSYLQTSSLIIFLLSMSMSLPGSYLQTSSVIIFLLSMSMSLPGVATRMCTPRFTTSIASLVGTPPMARHVRRSGRPWNRKPWQRM